MSTVIESRSSTPVLSPRLRVQLVPAGPALWRVLAPSGRVIGHLQAFAEDGGIRFRARRFHVATHAFRDLGDFWSADDAVECLRFAA